MDRKLKQQITLLAAMAQEEIIETMEKGGRRTEWMLILEKRMTDVAISALISAQTKPPHVFGNMRR